MGFDPRVAANALQVCGGDLDRAIQYVFANPSLDSVVQVPPPLPTEPSLSPEELQELANKFEQEERMKKQMQEDEESARFIQSMQLEEQKQKERIEEQRRRDEESARKMLAEEARAGKLIPYALYNTLLIDPKTLPPGHKFTCSVCYDEYDLDGIIVFDECKHFLCVEDMRENIRVQIMSGNAKELKCHEMDCKRPITYQEVRRVVPPEVFEVYQRFLTEAHLRSDPNCRWCPKAGCGTPMIGLGEDRPMMVCPRAECRFTYCFNCKEEWHADATCQQYQQWKIENNEADKRYLEWAAQNTKPCPACRSPIQKNGGCNHMKCISCKHEFCWLCSEKYKVGHYALDESHPCHGKHYT
eukprot:TRINITY_DN12502_c0_g1_i2.p1 TRINITY_DN12502_c0_g1~~TRINITY_DN12502_c0_g1_i2.p1  ORF type:complete len:417 (+),score=79.85 TRINITY_DN12502_c0_g1_i2:185-1252(+)